MSYVALELQERRFSSYTIHFLLIGSAAITRLCVEAVAAVFAAKQMVDDTSQFFWKSVCQKNQIAAVLTSSVSACPVGRVSCLWAKASLSGHHLWTSVLYTLSPAHSTHK